MVYTSLRNSSVMGFPTDSGKGGHSGIVSHTPCNSNDAHKLNLNKANHENKKEIPAVVSIQSLATSNSVLKRIEKMEEYLSSFQEACLKQGAELNLLEMRTSHLKGNPYNQKDVLDSQLNDESFANLNYLGHGLFPFICTHLENPSSKNIICWVKESKETFIIQDPTQFALMWGEEKKKEGMNKRKLYRSLTYLVNEKGLLKRSSNKNFMYTILNRKERKPQCKEKNTNKTLGSNKISANVNNKAVKATESKIFLMKDNGVISKSSISEKVDLRSVFTSQNHQYQQKQQIKQVPQQYLQQQQQQQQQQQEQKQPYLAKDSSLPSKELESLINSIKNVQNTHVDFTKEFSNASPNGINGNAFSTLQIDNLYDDISSCYTTGSSSQSSPINLPIFYHNATLNSPTDEMLLEDVPKARNILNNESEFEIPLDSPFDYFTNSTSHDSRAIIDNMYRQYISSIYY